MLQAMGKELAQHCHLDLRLQIPSAKMLLCMQQVLGEAWRFVALDCQGESACGGHHHLSLFGLNLIL